MISVWHANIFKGLIEAGSFTEEDVEIIRDYMLNRNFFGLREFLESKNCDEGLMTLFLNICRMYTPDSDEWKEVLSNSKSYKTLYDALEYLDKLYQVLKVYGVEEYILFETGSISEFDYYTGIIFAGYTYGNGEPIVTGGRYNNLLANFGKDRPAIGFGIFIDQLQMALNKQNILVTSKKNKIIMCYEPKNRDKAIVKANNLREQGNIVELIEIVDGIESIEALYDDDNSTIMEIK